MKRPWNWDTSIFFILTLFLWAVAIAGYIYLHPAHGQVPQQAQASNLAVPEPKHLPAPYKPYPYASGVVVSECSLVKAVVLIDRNGNYFPQRLSDLPYKKLLALLRDAAPADHILEVTLECPSDKST